MVFLFAVLALAIAGCDSGTGTAVTTLDASKESGAGMPTTTASVTPPPPPPIEYTYAPTYSAIWDELLFPTCSLPFCHRGGEAALTLATKELGYESLLSDRIGPLCQELGLKHVEPFDPDASLFYRKVTDAPCGDRMPLSFGGGKPLDPRQVEQIKRWIELGAMND